VLVRVGEGGRVKVEVVEAIVVADRVIVNEGSSVIVFDGTFVILGNCRISVWVGAVMVGGTVTSADRLDNLQAGNTRARITNGSNTFIIFHFFIYCLSLRFTFNTAIFVA
jgi:hypothetical protein